MSLATERILIDTGPLVALFDRNDPYHKACADQARQLPEGVFTCWPVITETCYLLRHRLDLVAELLEACHDGIYELLALGPRDIPEIGGMLQKFSDQSIDLADACLVCLANRDGIDHVMTVDQRHFSLFRMATGKPFTLLPQAE